MLTMPTILIILTILTMLTILTILTRKRKGSDDFEQARLLKAIRHRNDKYL